MALPPNPQAAPAARLRDRWRRRNDPALVRAMFFTGLRQAAAAVRIASSLVIGALAGLLLVTGG